VMVEGARSSANHRARAGVGAVGGGIAHAGGRRRPAMSNWATGGFRDLVLRPDLGKKKRAVLSDG